MQPDDHPESTLRLHFTATLRLEGKTATGIQVPAEIVSALGSSKRPAVRVSIGAHTYRTTVAAYGDVYMIPVSAENRAAAGIAAGDEVEVSLELDTQPREVVVPEDFAAVLDQDPQARRFFDSLSYSNKRRIVLQITDAKTAETRQRRIVKSVAGLHEGNV